MRLRRRHLIIAAVIAAVLAPVATLATAWVPAARRVTLAPTSPAIADGRASPAWSHERGRAWLVTAAGRDLDHPALRRAHAAPAPPGLAGATGDPIVAPPWWSRLRERPTDDDMAANSVIETAWGWPIPVLAMDIRTTAFTGIRGGRSLVDAWTIGTPPGRVRTLPTRPIWRGIPIAVATAWLVLLLPVLVLVLGVAWFAGVRTRRRQRRGACLGCGHQLPPPAAGAKALAQCPECGQPVGMIAAA